MLNTLVSSTELAENTNNQQWVIIDCRFSLADTHYGQVAYDAGHIARAQYAHLDHHLSSPIVPGLTGRHPLPDRDQLSQQLRSWGVSKTSQIVAYDDNIGAIAARLWWLCQWLGHEACAVLDGGFASWQRAGHELTTDIEQPVSGNFLPNTPLLECMSSESLAESKSGLLLLDAREEERFRGESEPIDPVAGHIPGALNYPFQLNVNENGKFKSAAQLHQQFSTVLARADEQPIVHYCGSGVTAAHNILAMTYAGLGKSMLYAGSFSEWITRGGEQFQVARLGD